LVLCSLVGPAGDFFKPEGQVVQNGTATSHFMKRSFKNKSSCRCISLICQCLKLLQVALNARIPAEMSENINELGLTESDQQAWMATNKQSHYTLFAAFLFFNILSYICGRVFAGRIDSPKLAAQAKHGIAQLCHATFAVSSAIYTLTHRPWVLGPGDCDPARLFCFDKLSSLYLDLHAGYLFYEWIFYLRSEAVLIPRFKYLGFHRTLLLLGYALAKVHPCILTVITLPFYQLLAVGQLAEARLDLAVAFRNLPRVCVDRLWYVVILAFFRAVGALTISFYSWWWISTRDLMHLDALRGKRTALNIAYSMLFVGGAFSLSLLYLNWFRAVGDSQKRVYAKITQAADRTSAGKVARETVNASSGTAKKKKKKKATRA